MLASSPPPALPLLQQQVGSDIVANTSPSQSQARLLEKNVDIESDPSATIPLTPYHSLAKSSLPYHESGEPHARPPSPSSSLSPPPPSSPDIVTSSDVAMPPKKKRVLVKRTPKSKKSKWDAESILTDSKSPLATADLRNLLKQPAAWEILSPEERSGVLALFPDNNHIKNVGTDSARPDFASLMNDDTFRHDCAEYTQNLREGRFDPYWLASAWAASDQRKAGEFDEYLVKKFESDWRVEVPNELKMSRKGHGNDGDDVEGSESRKREGSVSMDELQAEGEEKGDDEAKLPLKRCRRETRINVVMAEDEIDDLA